MAPSMQFYAPRTYKARHIHVACLLLYCLYTFLVVCMYVYSCWGGQIFFHVLWGGETRQKISYKKVSMKPALFDQSRMYLYELYTAGCDLNKSYIHSSINSSRRALSDPLVEGETKNQQDTFFHTN